MSVSDCLAAKQTPLEAVTSKLSDSVDQLESAYNSIAMKLTPLLQPEPPGEDDCGQDCPSCGPHVGNLLNLKNKILAVANQMGGLSDRLDC